MEREEDDMFDASDQDDVLPELDRAVPADTSVLLEHGVGAGGSGLPLEGMV